MADPGLLVLGARGMLGTDVTAALAAAGVPARGLDLPELDITDEDALRGVVSARSVIINCAAYTDVDRAEDQEALARRVNADAVAALGGLAAEAGAYVLHVSTDFVFDGTKTGAYTEDDPPNPLSAYGRTKLAGEQALAASGCRHGVIRIQWTYGRAGRHFVSKIAELARARDRIMVVDDQSGAPTATTEAALAILALADARAEGIHHFAAAGEATRFDVARTVVEGLGLSTVVEPCSSDHFITRAARPANSRFDCARVRALLGRPIRQWREVLDEYLEEGV